MVDRLHAGIRRRLSRWGMLAPISAAAGVSRELEQLRLAPAYVTDGIRVIDAQADLWYLGKGRWRLLTWTRPIRTVALGERIATAQRLLLEWDLPRVKANPGAFWRLWARYEYWIMVYRGGMRPIHDYQLQGAPNGAIVDDFRIADWLFRHVKDDEVVAMANTDADAKRDLGDRNTAAGGKRFDNDVKQALEAYGYLNRLSHPLWDVSPKDRARSGFSRVPRPTVAPQPTEEAVAGAGTLIGV